MLYIVIAAASAVLVVAVVWRFWRNEFRQTLLNFALLAIGFVTGFGGFRLQSEDTDDAHRRRFIDLLRVELGTVLSETETYEKEMRCHLIDSKTRYVSTVLARFVEPIVLNEALLSGLFDSQASSTMLQVSIIWSQFKETSRAFQNAIEKDREGGVPYCSKCVVPDKCDDERSANCRWYNEARGGFVVIGSILNQKVRRLTEALDLETKPLPPCP